MRSPQTVQRGALFCSTPILSPISSRDHPTTNPATALSRVEPVSWKPRAFVAHGFLSRDEARHLRKLSAYTVGHRPAGCYRLDVTGCLDGWMFEGLVGGFGCHSTAFTPTPTAAALHPQLQRCNPTPNPQLRRSTVLSPSGKSVEDTYRTRWV
jgi:hypothetical protein